MPISSNTAVITRGSSQSDGTAGKMVLLNRKGQRLEQDTLELPDLLNSTSISRCNAGAYLCKLTFSNTFQRKLYILQDVQGRTGIRFHRGNKAGDKAKGLKTDSAGCVLQGYSVAYDRAIQQQVILSSGDAEVDMIRFFQGEDFVLIIQ